MRPAVLPALLILAAGCSYTFDDDAPEVPLLGEAPDMTRLPRLNRAPIDDAYVVEGCDGTPWVAMFEPGDLLRVRRLQEPAGEEELHVKNPLIRWLAFFFVEPDADPEQPTKVTIRCAGEQGPGDVFLMPPGPSQLMTGGPEDVFMYWVTRPDTKTFQVVRRYGGFVRTLPVPEGVDPTKPLEQGGFFDGYGKRLYVRDGKGRVTSYSTVDDQDIDLGVRPRRMILLDDTMLTCGEDGLRTVPLIGGADTVLDPAACDSSGMWFLGDTLLYDRGDQMLRVPLDGSRQPVVVFDGTGKQVLLVGPDANLVYSTDPAGRYANNASDGWLGDWRFMERGRLPSFSYSSKRPRRLRWLERAATLTGAGDLLSATVPGGAPVRLAKNVTRYGELSDGRLLAVANYAFWGTQNRIIVIDEDTRQAQWVADSSSSFHYIPGSRDLLVFITTGGSGFDLARVSVPKALPQP